MDEASQCVNHQRLATMPYIAVAGPRRWRAAALILYKLGTSEPSRLKKRRRLGGGGILGLTWRLLSRPSLHKEPVLQAIFHSVDLVVYHIYGPPIIR